MFKWFWTIFSLGAPDIIADNFSRNTAVNIVFMLQVNIKFRLTLLHQSYYASEWLVS